MNRMKVLVTGATGMLGSSLVLYLRAKGMDVVGHGRMKAADINVDLCDKNKAFEMLDAVGPDSIVHLVCLSDVDACEKDPDQAFKMNVEALENVVAWINNHGNIRLVHISTDHLYDGPGKHSEGDVTIRNTYALSKYCSELVALQAEAIVLRTNFFGKSKSEEKNSFTDWLIDSLRHKENIILFTDVFFNPLSMETLSMNIHLALQSDVSGVFNVGSRGGMSKYDFACAIASRLGLALDNARAGILEEVNLKAVRPTGMLMDCARFEQVFRITLPSLEDEIKLAEI